MNSKPKSIFECLDEHFQELDQEDEDEENEIMQNENITNYDQGPGQKQDKSKHIARPKDIIKWEDINKLDVQEDDLFEIQEAPEESVVSQVKDNENFNFDYEIPVLMLDDDSQISQGKKIKLAGLNNYIKSKEKERQQVEENFQRIVQQKAEELIQEQKKEELMKKIQKQSIPSKLQQKVQSLFQQVDYEANPIKITAQQSITNSTNTPSLTKKKQNDNEQVSKLKEEILNLKNLINDYKLRYNQDQDLIKTLRVTIQKGDTNQSRTSCSTKASKTDDLINENEQLKQDMITLKQQHQKEIESLKQQLSRVQKIQVGCQQRQQKDQVIPDKTKEEITKLQAEKAQQGSDFRNKLNEATLKIQQKDQELEKLKKQIKTMQEQKEQPDKQQIVIEDLKQQIQKLNQQIEEIKQKYLFDNQLKLLFPIQQDNVLAVLNIFYKLENTKNAVNFIKTKLNTGFTYVYSKIYNVYKWFKQMIKFKWTKSVVHHPDNQQLVKEAIQKIRTNPTVLETENQKLTKTLIQLGQENKDLQEKLSSLQIQYNQKIEIYGQLDELVRVDKIQLANQLMMRILKKEAEDRNNEQQIEYPELQIVKKYAELIMQSTLPQYQKSQSPKQDKNTKAVASLQGINNKQVSIAVTKCGHIERHQKRDQKPTKGQYYNK
ncbi:unnamed protein product (macronuclear) [Paramecium tetraurelia]|uniref:Centrosomal protein of 162 kDa n=1 Tax=Paramecium tetraurelia TaxID=5888 RepID=A0CCV0_PARTE|nr:uncharacterized protein GSPATT00037402001 [Paramecium tetraurelia]CAK68617.1 unnamed protein product [Paramecium tetraurelia]|eukprot:XP_001436014.1 hypothetical protein (macronuclear) [Paramecium tetraurelia strain d4-2]